MPLPTCTRCGALNPMNDIDVHDTLLQQQWHICSSCMQSLVSWLTTPPSVMLMAEFLDDIDDAEHHAACRCHECDADFHMELARDNRYDAARRTA